VEHDEDRSLEIGRKLPHQLAERFDAACRGADHHDVTARHPTNVRPAGRNREGQGPTMNESDPSALAPGAIGSTVHPMAYNVAIVDDHRLFRDGFRALISSTADLRVVAEASNSDEALPVLRSSRAEVVVLDVMLPGMSGIAIARELLKENPSRRLLALSMAEDEAHVADAFKTGMLGYASKRQPAAEVLEAIRTVARGERYLAPDLSDLARAPMAPPMVPAPLAALTAREREIFELCVSGMASKEIAQQLHISPRTVETHRARILRKLGARSAVDLVRLAAKCGLLPA